MGKKPHPCLNTCVVQSVVGYSYLRGQRWVCLPNTEGAVKREWDPHLCVYCRKISLLKCTCTIHIWEFCTYNLLFKFRYLLYSLQKYEVGLWLQDIFKVWITQWMPKDPPCCLLSKLHRKVRAKQLQQAVILLGSQQVWIRKKIKGLRGVSFPCHLACA